jgi:hypothetical protein
MSHILHKALVTYVLAAMQTFFPTRSRTAEYRAVAEAIVTGAPDPTGIDEVQLASIGSFESGYATHAWSKDGLGCYGVWQICPFPRLPIPRTLTGQAREALRRWNIGRCFYTGEANRRDGRCPLADERYFRALDYVTAHPFVAPAEDETELAER